MAKEENKKQEELNDEQLDNVSGGGCIRSIEELNLKK